MYDLQSVVYSDDEGHLLVSLMLFVCCMLYRLEYKMVCDEDGRWMFKWCQRMERKLGGV